MRVGIVCPYSFDVPGGVQSHVRDLAETLLAAGQQVSVLAPSLAGEDRAGSAPHWLEPAGRAVPVPWNGAVARVSFGPLTARRVRRWLADGAFDVLHLHEPVTPSLSLLALWAATGPVVATFHAASARSMALQAAQPVVVGGLEKLGARIAVSEEARRRVVEHLGGDAVVVPNGVHVDRFATARPRPQWQGRPGAPTLAFLGRLEEPRKGFAVLAAALPALRAAVPGLRVLVAGHGDPQAARRVAGSSAAALEVLGSVSDEDKAALLASVDALVAPQTGGESFGLVLVEAMSAGAPVVASALPAFVRVLDGGRLGVLVPVGDAAALAGAVLRLLGDPGRAAALAAAASSAVRRYDWSRVGHEVLSVYEAVTGAGSGPGAPAGDPGASRLLESWRSAGPPL